MVNKILDGIKSHDHCCRKLLCNHGCRDDFNSLTSDIFSHYFGQMAGHLFIASLMQCMDVQSNYGFCPIISIYELFGLIFSHESYIPYVARHAKTDHLCAKTEIHFESFIHAKSRNTKYLTIDDQVCFDR